MLPTLLLTKTSNKRDIKESLLNENFGGQIYFSMNLNNGFRENMYLIICLHVVEIVSSGRHPECH